MTLAAAGRDPDVVEDQDCVLVNSRIGGPRIDDVRSRVVGAGVEPGPQRYRGVL